MNNIDELLEKYFEGQTSSEEEAVIRRFFVSDDIPENLAIYKPLFAYFDEEIKKTDVANDNNIQSENKNGRRIENDKKLAPKNRRYILWLSGAAACAAILTGIFFNESQSKRCPGEGDYVIIDGRCYTDINTIRNATLNSLREISAIDFDLSEDNSSEASGSSGAKRIIENQLKGFDFLLDE